MTVVTNRMLIEKIAEVNQEARLLQKNGSYKGGSTVINNTSSSSGGSNISIFNIVKIKDNTMITDNGIKAELFSPMPCLHWKCLTDADSTGVITLKTKLKGLFINDGSNYYCIGISGSSDEFEVRLQVGTSEVRLNKDFLNLVSPLISKNGVELK